MAVQDDRMIQSPEASGGRGGAGRFLVRGLLAIGLIAIGAVGATLALRVGSHTPAAPVTAVPPSLVAETPATAAPTAPEPADEIEVLLSPEAVVQAGIKTKEVGVIESSPSIQVPGVVMANAYREVKVMPLVGGIVRKVHAEL
jgi:hypothetical protein